MESQFVSPFPGPLLGDISFNFPEGTHAVGRLDKHSEGLLLLTTNKKITTLLFQSKVPHRRTYLVQAKHIMNEESLHRLRTGVKILLRGGGGEYTTPPCEVDIVEPPADLFPSPRIFPPYLQSTWLTITLTEGRYRQVRKMMAAVRHRCMRLIRVSIEDLSIGSLKPGEVEEIKEDVFFQKLKLDNTSAP